MPLDRLTISLKTFAEELGFDLRRFIGVQVNKRDKYIVVLLEPEERNDTRRTDHRHDSATGG